MRKRYALIAVCLLTGLFIYVFYRTEKTLVNELIIQIISFPNYLRMRYSVATFLPLNNTIIYSLPGGLWVFCITITSKSFYLQLFSRKIDCALVPLLFSIGLELLQLFHITNGSFDLRDVIFSIAFWALAYFFFDDHATSQNILTPLNKKRLVCFTSYGIVYLSHVLK